MGGQGASIAIIAIGLSFEKSCTCAVRATVCLPSPSPSPSIAMGAVDSTQTFDNFPLLLLLLHRHHHHHYYLPPRRTQSRMRACEGSCSAQMRRGPYDDRVHAGERGTVSAWAVLGRAVQEAGALRLLYVGPLCTSTSCPGQARTYAHGTPPPGPCTGSASLSH